MIPADTAWRWDYVDSLVRRWFPPGEQAAEPELSDAARRLGPLSPALAALAARAAGHEASVRETLGQGEPAPGGPGSCGRGLPRRLAVQRRMNRSPGRAPGACRVL